MRLLNITAESVGKGVAACRDDTHQVIKEALELPAVLDLIDVDVPVRLVRRHVDQVVELAHRFT